MARPKTYHIILSDNEVSALRKVIRDKKTCKTVLKRCQILLELDEVNGTGLTHSQIAHTYAVCPATVTNIIQSYVKNGITNIVKLVLCQEKVQVKHELFTSIICLMPHLFPFVLVLSNISFRSH